MKEDSKNGQARAERQASPAIRTSGQYSESARIHKAISDVHRKSSTNENLTAAKSRVKDADISAESANMTRGQILQQASLAMLSQVNPAPRNLLSLIS